MVTHFWSDQSWFSEIMHLVIELPRRFRPSPQLLWNVITLEAIPKVMKSIKLTAWRLTSQSKPTVVSKRKSPGKSETPGQEIPSRSTRGSLNSGVLSAMKEGHQSFKFV